MGWVGVGLGDLKGFANLNDSMTLYYKREGENGGESRDSQVLLIPGYLW